jgi:hypothetical protein
VSAVVGDAKVVASIQGDSTAEPIRKKAMADELRKRVGGGEKRLEINPVASLRSKKSGRARLTLDLPEAFRRQLLRRR